jgi:aryl-alcohol dehydrogenase-like predicted oxidoreductase
VAQSAVAGGAAAGLLHSARAAAPDAAAVGTVKKRPLGKTGLMVSEIGFGGHSWAYARVPDGKGGFRQTSPEEAERMLAIGIEMGVNFIDACTPKDEHAVPGDALKRMKKRDQMIISVRLCHKMKGVDKDQDFIYKFVDERLKLFHTDRFELLMVTNEVDDTPRGGYWDMSYSIEAIEKLKKQGKVRFSGFGCHFPAELFLEAVDKYGKAFDVCSMPYNIRHRLAEQVLPVAKRAGMGVVTIKPLARGALLAGRDTAGADAGLARDMIAFVLENPDVDVAICGVHTEAHVRENFGASWTRLSPERRERLDKLAAADACPGPAWLEKGWRAA